MIFGRGTRELPCVPNYLSGGFLIFQRLHKPFPLFFPNLLVMRLSVPENIDLLSQLTPLLETKTKQ